MTEDEFHAWQMYNSETPIDDVSVHHLPLGYVAAMRFSTKERPLTPQECMPWLPLGDFTEDSEPSNPEAMAAMMQAIAESHNSTQK